MTTELHLEAARLLLRERWAALATLHDGAPLASMVAYAPAADLSYVALFLSELSAHTRDLLADPRASLAVTAPDSHAGDPALLPRVTLQGRADLLGDDSPDYAAAKKLYVDRFPDAATRFGLGDFHLFAFRPAAARYVGGFARALVMDANQLTQTALTAS